jgi:nucleoside-diphosphate kinase
MTHRARLNAPDSWRAEFGISDTRNAFHGSDSEATAQREMDILFSNSRDD